MENIKTYVAVTTQIKIILHGATSLENAIKMICDIEQCPPSAILSIEEVKK